MITGKAYWARVVGEPHENKFKEGGKQWSFDLCVDQENADKLLKAGMKKTYIRDKDDERGTFISFTRDSVKQDGTAGKPFEIIDAAGNPWPQDKLIGNGSILNVSVALNERTFRGEKFLKPGAIRLQVWEHSPYEKTNNFPTKEVTETVDQAANW